MPLRRGTDSEKYENGTSKEGQKRDAGQVQVQRRREGRHAIENVSCCHRMSRPEATTVNIFQPPRNRAIDDFTLKGICAGII